MNLINIENITKSYTDTPLFNEASFTVDEHEKVGIIGINGTGKTTLLKILVGLEEPDAGKLALLLLSYFILEVETAAICFGISAFISQSGLGIGLGIATLFYFLNIVANLTEKARFLKYFTPFGYTDSADIISECTLNGSLLAVGMALGAAGILAAFRKYTKKDIA